MSPRLLVNPGTPQAWEIQLKAGTNRIGRGEQNDFQIPHGSISGTHCEVVVGGDGSVTLRDLGSTNGTFINRAPVKEAVLQPGQHLQLGAVDMIFESAAATASAPATPSAPAPVRLVVSPAPTASVPPPPAVRMTGSHSAGAPPSATPAPTTPPLPPPVTARPAGLRLSGGHQAVPAAAPAAIAVVQEEGAEAPPPLEPTPLAAGAQFCKFHAKTPARFYCAKCQKFFCDLCVGTRAGPGGSVRTCRACSSTVTPVQVNIQRAHGEEKGFFGQLPGALVYPFKGTGVLILIFATILIAGLDAVGYILLRILAVGYLFVFLQSIIHSTAAGDKELPGLPEFDGLFGAFLTMMGTVLMSFGIPIALGLWAIFGEQEGLGTFIIGTTIIGCLYFPMAFLATAMKDSAFASNPLVVIPAILKVPGEYLVAAVLMTGAFGMRELGDLVMAGMKNVGYATRDMSVLFMSIGLRAVWSFVSIYLLAVVMRVLGLLYVTKKHKFGWFAH